MYFWELDKFKQEYSNSRAYEELYTVVKRDLDAVFAKGIYSLLDHGVPLSQSFDDTIIKSVSQPINTYPFGKKTDELFPRLLCVCNELSDFKKTFKHILSYFKRRVAGYRNEESQAVLFTSSWDPEVFSEFEVDLLNLWIQENIRLVIYLYNDYGVTKVPFIGSEFYFPRYSNRDAVIEHSRPDEQSIWAIQNIKTMGKIRIQMIPSIWLMNSDPAKYADGDIDAVVDPEAKVCVINGRVYTKIKPTDINKLVCGLAILKDMGIYGGTMLDGGYTVVSIYGKEIPTFTLPEEVEQSVEKCINVFLSTVKCKYKPKV